MADSNLLTYGAQVAGVKTEYFNPVAVAIDNPTVPLKATYCFLSKVDPWTNDSSPPTPTQDQHSIKLAYKNMFVVKQVTSADISGVIQRIDWTANTVYNYYSDTVDMLQIVETSNNESQNQDTLVYNFYAKNSYDQVFKCLWNNNGGPSTYMPYFQPGSYNTDNIFQQADGYKWKYIYTVDLGSKVKFMNSQWLPVPLNVSFPPPNPLAAPAGIGSIDVINVIDGGLGYNPTVNTITLIINGDGTGAAAIPVCNATSIIDITVTNPGENYTWATVSIAAKGVIIPAQVIAPVSPIGGHGFDPSAELGCFRSMYVVEFDGSEGGLVPTNITYTQVGMLVNPLAISTAPEPANGTIYSTTTNFIVSSGFGVYQNDEMVFQGNTLPYATFSGTVLSFDVSNNVLYLINTYGIPTNSALVTGNQSGCARTMFSYTTPDLQIYTGYITYLDNRSGIQRSPDGNEQIKFIWSF